MESKITVVPVYKVPEDFDDLTKVPLVQTGTATITEFDEEFHSKLPPSLRFLYEEACGFQD
jgi:hypothetical protein